MNSVEGYEKFIWPLIRGSSANGAHESALKLLQVGQGQGLSLRAMERFFDGDDDERLSVEFGGVMFDNPLVLAAGFDKNGIVVPGVRALGFGGMEVGSVLYYPQEGNPPPNIFRVLDKSLFNYMGFPSEGVLKVKENLQKQRLIEGFPVGINVGINHNKLSEAAFYYSAVVEKLYEEGDFFVLNLSSPNTRGLRKIQENPTILKEVILATREVMEIKGGKKPLFIKISVDESSAVLKQLVKVSIDLKINGLVVGNSSTNAMIKKSLGNGWEDRDGGVSGEAIEHLSSLVLQEIAKESGGELDLAGCGGVMDLKSAISKMRAGAKVLEIFSGLVFKGPGITKWLKAELISYMESEGINNLEQIRGYK